MKFLLCGEIASGKDLVASMLPGKHFSFAGDIKEVSALLRANDIFAAFGLMDHLFQGNAPNNLGYRLDQFSEYPREQGKDRRLYQDLGMWARSIYPDIWVDSVKRKVSQCHNAVITDCRFHNEFNAFPDFISIYVDASEEVRRERMVSRDGEVKQGSLGHAAESQVRELKDKCKYVIENNGTIEELRSKVDYIVNWEEFSLTN